jgi:CBS-domain-containing membrane protein
MDERHLYFAALVASPWLAIGGAVALAYGLLFCCDVGQLASGGAALGGALGAGALAWEGLWAVAMPVPLAPTR